MNITIYTFEEFVKFIFACFLFGLTSSLFYCAWVTIFSIGDVICINTLDEFKRYVTAGDLHKIKFKFMKDFILCLIIATSLIFVSFIYNSGNFRFISIPVLSIGFCISNAVFGKIVKVILVFIIYILKRIIELIILPFRYLIIFFASIIRKLVIYICRVINTKRIKKYTYQRYKDLDKIKQSGLIESWFEV